jgi:hypothetical protein
VIVDLANRDKKGAEYCPPEHFAGPAVPSASERAWLASLRCLYHKDIVQGLEP